MIIFTEIKPDLVQSSCLALGVFDGVHLGHQKVILDAVNKAGPSDALATVVTFTGPPQAVTSKRKIKLITSLDDKLEIFENLGVQAALVLDFTEELSKIPAERYIKEVLYKGLHPKTITVGYNHHFGVNRKGDIKLLEKYSSEFNYEVTVISPITCDGHIISSSSIRRLTAVGDVLTASKLLGRPFSIKGKVVEGKKRGRLLGFPTANLNLPDNLAYPLAGVYSGRVEYENKSYPAVINVGKRPTYGDLMENLLEAHLLNFEGDLYNQEIRVYFLNRLRDEQKFNSEQELREQIRQDCLRATTENIF